MNYENFKKIIENNILSQMPEEYQKLGLKVKIREFQKTNVKYDGLTFEKPNLTNKVSPIIYIQPLYETYKNGISLKEIFDQIVKVIIESFEKSKKIELPNDMKNKDKIKENIVFMLINTDANKEMLVSVPHRKYMDLSIVYRWIISIDEEGIQSTLIDNNLLNMLELDENELFLLASKNTKRLMPPTINTMNEIINSILLKFRNDPEMIDEIIKENLAYPAYKFMWVISNKVKINGAISIIYEDILHNLAERLNSDLYILPSSIHEVIVLSANEFNQLDYLSKMVTEVNNDQVKKNERLSNNVYYYDKKERTMFLVTDNSNI